MAMAAGRPCGHPRCPRVTLDGWCDEHRPPRDRRHEADRPSSAARGYGRQWRRVREEVLARAGIPRERWPAYDVDHSPPYDPAVEPDHRRYQLTPRLHAEHSRKTAQRDGGFGAPTRRR